MPLYQQFRISRLLLISLIWLSLILVPPLLWAEATAGFVVQSAWLQRQDHQYRVNADIRYQFSRESLTALEHGVALQIVIDIRAKQLRNLFWDKIIREETVKLQLEHHPLTGNYLVTNLDTGIKNQFHVLPNALEFLGSVRNYPFLKTAAVEPDKSYTMQVRARLNIGSLPAPLQLSAHTSPDWQFASPWYQWSITK